MLQQHLLPAHALQMAVQGGVLQQCRKYAAAGPHRGLLQPQQLRCRPHLVPETPLALLPQRLWRVEYASAGLHQPHAHAGDWQEDSPSQTCRQLRPLGRQTRLYAALYQGTRGLHPAVSAHCFSDSLVAGSGSCSGMQAHCQLCA